MASDYLARIDAPNLKTGVACDLGPRTLVIGANATGKSALVTALRLVLTGRDDDLGAQGSAIMELARAGAKSLDVVGRLASGDLVTFRVEGTTAKAKAPVWFRAPSPDADPVVVSRPIAVLALGEARAILAREPKAQRAALLKAACGAGLHESVVRAAIPEAFRPEWDRVWAATSGESADRLVAVREALKGDLKAARDAAKGEIGDRPRGAVEDVAIDDLRDRLDRARAVQVAAARYAAAREGLAWLQAEDRRLSETLAEKGVGVSREALDFARLRADACGAAARVARFAQAHAIDACLSCNREGVGDVAMAALDDRAVRAQEAFDRLVVAQRGAETDADAKRLRAVVEKREEAEIVIAAGDPGTGEAVAPLEALLADVVTTSAAVRAWDQRRAAQVQAAGRVDMIAALIKSADRLIGEALDGAIESFCAKGDAVLGEVEHLGVQLIDKGREVCRVGLRRANVLTPWRALSGAERARCLAALAVALSAGVDTDALRVAVCDDVWLDQASLNGLLAGLSRAIDAGALAQAVVCAVTWTGDLPAGWMVVWAVGAEGGRDGR